METLFKLSEFTFLHNLSPEEALYLGKTRNFTNLPTITQFRRFLKNHNFLPRQRGEKRCPTCEQRLCKAA